MVDGARVEGRVADLVDDGREHRIRVRMARLSADEDVPAAAPGEEPLDVSVD